MTKLVTEGARLEISACRPSFSRFAASLLARACTLLPKSEEKERLLAEYNCIKVRENKSAYYFRKSGLISGQRNVDDF